MTGRQRGGSAPKRALSVSVVVGTLLVPLSAIAALWLTDPAQPDAGSAGSEVATPAVETPAGEEIAVGTDGSPNDLAIACGPAGLELVALENQRALSDIQQAALDALRPICAGAGLPLPAPDTPDSAVQAPAVSQEVVPATTPATTVTIDDDDRDDDHDDDHDDDDHDDDDDDHDDEDDD